MSKWIILGDYVGCIDGHAMDICCILPNLVDYGSPIYDLEELVELLM